MKKDKKAIALLKRYYSWSGSWQKKPLTEKEIQYCMEKGVMFPTLELPHDQVIKEIKEMADAISMEEAVHTFLCSISSSDNRYRTILSSVIFGKCVPLHHALFSLEKHNRECLVCSLHMQDEKYCKQNLNSYSKFRYHSGVEDIHAAGYVWLDLKEYRDLPKVNYNEDSIRILNRIFGLVQELTSANKVVALQKLITAEKFFPTTKNQINTIFAVLSACGIFDTPKHKSILTAFIPNSQRNLIAESEFAYPLNYWRGKHGINYDAVTRIFCNVVGNALDEENTICGEVKRENTERQCKSKAEQYFTEGVHGVELTNASRYYYGLKEINSAWDKVTKYSTTHSLYKRTEIYFNGDIVEKVIYEEQDKGGWYYQETDMNVRTEERSLVYPKTNRGRKQPLTPTHLLTPTYMEEQLHVKICDPPDSFSVWSYNNRNDQYLPLPPGKVRNNRDFQEYTKHYINDLPEDYDDTITMFHKKNRNTVSIPAGAVFRVHLTPKTYTYGLILGRVRDMLKWKEIPDEHPLQACMAQPILYRQYDIVTENRNMTPDELRGIPLRPVDCAQDNEILWETYPIIGHIKLQESDIDLGFGIYKRSRPDFDAKTMGKNDPYRREKKVAVVMGFGAEWFDESLFEDILEQMQHITFGCYATGLSIHISSKITDHENRITSLRHIVEERLNLSRENSMDEFATKYSGITRKQFIALAENNGVLN